MIIFIFIFDFFACNSRFAWFKINLKYKNIRIVIKKGLDKINFIILNLGVIIVDCFFLRRFIDKSYIKNGIVYTGAAHSTIYIWFLIKFYNYKIAEFDYLKNI